MCLASLLLPTSRHIKSFLPGKRRNLLFLFVCLFLGHSWRCSGPTPHSVLIDPSWHTLGTIWNVGIRKTISPELAHCFYSSWVGGDTLKSPTLCNSGRALIEGTFIPQAQAKALPSSKEKSLALCAACSLHSPYLFLSVSVSEMDENC